ncbi:MAG: hypothetical protein IT405_01650 [Candidatus Yanofskybacteria bacterium]|nr:hypothetical protein [Candidatus Yanofskybacteria bacterium]
MAIQKDDALLKLDRFQREQLKRVESEIDALLFEQYYNAPIIIDFSEQRCPRLHVKVWTELKRRYERAGWTVTLRGKKIGKYNGIELG